MNNTRTTTLAIVAVLTAVTLVVGLTVAATITPSAFAGGKKDRQDEYKKGRQAYGKDDGSGNGNTNTIQILKQKAKASGKNSTVEQNGQNVICTHPSSSSPDTAGTCTSQSNQPLEVE